MRGRTLSNTFVILDEAQNTTPVQMKMFLTRLGEDSRMVMTGDLSQIDLPHGVRSGLQDAVDVLNGVEGISFVRFTEADVVRHPLVSRIVRAYDARDKTTAGRAPWPEAVGRKTARWPTMWKSPCASPTAAGGRPLTASPFAPSVPRCAALDAARRRRSGGGSGNRAGELSLTFGDDATLRTLNRRYRGKDKPTNVLSFGSPDDWNGAAPGQPCPLGDVILARRDRAAGSAGSRARRRRIIRPIWWFTACCICWATTTSAAPMPERMEAIETDILARLGIADPYRMPARRRGQGLRPRHERCILLAATAQESASVFKGLKSWLRALRRGRNGEPCACGNPIEEIIEESRDRGRRADQRG